MRRLCTLVLILILCFAFLLISEIGIVKAESTIYIRADGSIEGTDNISQDAKIYTFTDDITGSFVVEKDGIVVDGAGYTLQGNGEYTGINLQDRNNVTVRNVKIRDFSCGIGLRTQPMVYTTSENNIISGNTITNNEYGIWIRDFSKSNIVSRNNITNNDYGIFISYSSENVLRYNHMNNNTYNFWVACDTYRTISDFTNDVDSSNTVDGKPIYYWVNQEDKTVPSEAGYVALVNCTDITVKNLNLVKNGQGILLVFTTNSLITKNNITNNGEGIHLYRGSHDNDVTENNITNNNNDGLYLHESYTTKIIENNITNNQDGIDFRNSRDANIIGNTITENNGWGIRLAGYSNNTISVNYIANNSRGILVEYSVQNKIIGNTIIENNGWGIQLGGTQINNVIYHNNFVNNKVENDLQVDIPMQWLPGWEPGNPNVWDNGFEGNYWSDYEGKYPNATELDGSGIWNTPYVIDGNNQDNYPLVPEFPTWTPMLFTLIVLAVAIAICKQRLPKTPIH